MLKALDLAERMKKELIKAIAVGHVVGSAASDSALIECFNVGLAGNAFEVMRHSLLFDQMMALMRIWDGGDDAQSLKQLAHLLSNDRLVDEIIERERHASCDIKITETEFGERRQELPFSVGRTTPQLREDQLRARLRDWLGNVNKVRGSAETARLRFYRNKVLLMPRSGQVLSRHGCLTMVTNKNC